MTLVLSHTTARLYYQTVARPDYLQVAPEDLASLTDFGPPDKKQIEFARVLLHACGIPLDRLDEIDLLVGRAQDRRAMAGVRCHFMKGGIPAAALRRIGHDIYVVCPELCALQAAERLDFTECVEYFYELCGKYRMSLEDYGSYAECRQAATTEQLQAYFAAHASMHGIRTARRAIRYVRDGARSPLETALVMMLVMPKREGGLGIRDIEMDRLIPVEGYAEKLTTSRWFYADIYLRRARLVIEYDGFLHEVLGREAGDNERDNALRAMGYEVVRVNRKNFFDREAFGRAVSAVCRHAGIRPSHLPAGFSAQQEELRQFVLRRWLNSSTSAEQQEHTEEEIYFD